MRAEEKQCRFRSDGSDKTCLTIFCSMSVPTVKSLRQLKACQQHCEDENHATGLHARTQVCENAILAVHPVAQSALVYQPSLEGACLSLRSCLIVPFCCLLFCAVVVRFSGLMKQMAASSMTGGVMSSSKAQSFLAEMRQKQEEQIRIQREFSGVLNAKKLQEQKRALQDDEDAVFGDGTPSPANGKSSSSASSRARDRDEFGRDRQRSDSRSRSRGSSSGGVVAHASAPIRSIRGAS